MSKIKYVFWDHDNTLIDNRDLHWRKHVSVLAGHGITLGDEHQQTIYHNNGSQNWEWLTRDLGLSAPRETYLKEIDAWYSAHIADAPLRPGVQEALEMFRDSGMRQAVVSNGRRDSVMAAQKAKGIEQFFDVILCKEDYEGRKPDPAPYLTGMARMNIKDAFNCLAIEDDPLGVTAAKRAGMVTMHRLIDADQPLSPDADHTAFTADEFLAVLSRLAL